MNIGDLAKDIEFCKAYPIVWNGLEKWLLYKQREFAASHRDDFEEVGRFVAFTGIIMDDLKSLDVATGQKTREPKRPKLHNRDFQPS